MVPHQATENYTNDVMKFLDEAIGALRKASSRKAAHGWFAATVLGMMIGMDRLGVTSVIRALELAPRYDSAVRLFRSKRKRWLFDRRCSASDRRSLLHPICLSRSRHDHAADPNDMQASREPAVDRTIYFMFSPTNTRYPRYYHLRVASSSVQKARKYRCPQATLVPDDPYPPTPSSKMMAGYPA